MDEDKEDNGNPLTATLRPQHSSPPLLVALPSVFQPAAKDVNRARQQAIWR